jgi:hypothetical protein
MTKFFFWAVWTSVSALGIRYASSQLLNNDITFLSSVLLVLIYQWIRFIKPPQNNENDLKEITKPNTRVPVNTNKYRKTK